MVEMQEQYKFCLLVHAPISKGIGRVQHLMLFAFLAALSAAV